jgi:type III secretion protein V
MKKVLASLPSRAELMMAITLIGIVLVLVVPLNRWWLDTLTIVSMASCLLVLLMSVRVQSPVQLLTFPALILITTMLRLSLNVASTKMILLEGRAGHVIETFGQIVMGQNILVGFCVFAIVCVVQFLVVAKGADRVAEVAARFSLDAMPGKQMSIDAEMRAGNLTADQASKRRDRLDIESRFFGGMDGAMKFVKGDAIAGLIIAMVNIIGGLASGMAYHGMTAGAALHRYTTLSIGDAIVSQVPSFMIAVAAGLITTRVTSSHGVESDLGQQMLGEIKNHPNSLSYVGLFCILLALVPGFPVIIFLSLGFALMLCGYNIRRATKKQQQANDFSFPMPSFCGYGETASPPFINDKAETFDASLVLSVPLALAQKIDPTVLDAKVAEVKNRLANHWGSPYPGLRCCIDKQPSAQSGTSTDGPEYKLHWMLIGSFNLVISWREDARLNLGNPSPHDDGPLGFPGFPEAQWEPLDSTKDSTQDQVRLEEVIARVTEHLCVREQGRLLTHEQFRHLLTELQSTHPQLTEALAAALPLPVLTDTVRTLLREGLNLRSLPQICDMLLSLAPLPQDANSIADLVITGWSRRRCMDAAVHGVLTVHVVDPLIESVLRQYVAQLSDEANNVTNDVLDIDAFREVRQLFSDLAARIPRGRINLVCRGPARLLVSEIASMASSRFMVFSFRGINPRFNMQVLSRIELSAAAKARMRLQDEFFNDPLEQPAFPEEFNESAVDDWMEDIPAESSELAQNDHGNNSVRARLQ